MNTNPTVDPLVPEDEEQAAALLLAMGAVVLQAPFSVRRQ
jgi:hypothetical protein